MTETYIYLNGKPTKVVQKVRSPPPPQTEELELNIFVVVTHCPLE